ncbi:hypothetical protein [Xylella fastidiosa]|uniref:hypothetical protein n=1 Tax=Xylella fastidiosa TaxID=2371 RepID=UPI00234CE85C|nr:hypothetical protein [Xylella fastidiosa]MDC6410600.1 hypothetical protein [Xylella fastidiosa subsp. multiplex]MDD0952348.1 hypothetical protein [Xylella fastidiosa subsp. multiplex]MDD0959069.1 hypothetical protein [Xylella fastidiosa subsp. multiplex]
MINKNHLKRHYPTKGQGARGKGQGARGKGQGARGKHIIAANPGYHAMPVLEASPSTTPRTVHPPTTQHIPQHSPPDELKRNTH